MTKKNFSLIGAGAIGVAALTLGTAGIAGAQEADAPSTTDPAVEESEDSRQGRRGNRNEGRQAQVQNVIDGLIADGTITQDQVDNAESARELVKAQREEARAEKLEELAGTIGISVEELQAAKADGSSLADIAGDSLGGVVDLFVERSTERVNAR